MSSHHHPSDRETLGSVDSVSADHLPPARWQLDNNSAPRIRLMCSFGGRILPRPHDNQLRYVGGDTRIVAVHRNCTFATLLSKLAKFTATTDIIIKYQLPNEDLDALISLTADEDLDNMMEEYDRLLAQGSSAHSRTARLRLFLFPSDGGGGGFGSILSGTASSKHERWFLDALNGRPLERGRSEASSIVSEVPDYLFGLENNSDELMKPKTNISVSDPGSPAPAVSSPHYSSASSAHSAIPPTAAVEIKQEIVDTQAEPELSQQGQGGYASHPVWQYMPAEPVPVYFVPGAVQGGNLPVRPVPMPMPVPSYVPPVQQVVRGPIPAGYRPVYVAAQPVGRPTIAGAYEYPSGSAVVGADTYEVRAGGGLMRNSPGVVPMYRPAVGVPPGTGESPAMSSDMRIHRSSQ